MSMFLQGTSSLFVMLLLLWPQTSSAAEVAIDTTVSTAADSATVGGTRTVFVSDSTGYVFYRDRDGRCVYQKTTDQGATWNGAVVFDNQTDCIKVSVWYDRWTPGDDTGTYIHLATVDTGLDDVFYNRLDTSNDTLLTTTSVNASTNSGQSPTVANNANTVTITKDTNDGIYIALNDNSDGFVVGCTANCDTVSNWSEIGPGLLDAQNDHNILVPLANGDVMIINRDISTNDIRSAIWNGTAWSSWDVIDTNAVESFDFDGGISAVTNKNNGNVYLAYTADNNDFTTSDHDIRTALYDGTGWTNQSDVLTNVSGRGIHDVAIGIDENNDEVYVAYAIRDTIGSSASGNVYYKLSSTAMTSWGSEQGPVSATAGDIYGPTLTLFDNERMYVTWYNNTTQTLYGETVANIGPDTIAGAVGTAISEVRAGSTDVYLGGKFSIESISSRSVSAITLTETGTIDGETELSDIALFYELDTTAPYDCVSETYSGGESQFGATDTDGFSGPDGVSVFSGTVVGISPTQTLCLYPVVSASQSATDGATIDIVIEAPPTDVTVSGTAAFPTTPINIAGVTTIVSPNLTQTHYHWRNDDGSETGATSATGGIEDTPLSALTKNTPQRLRLGISNEGSTSTELSDYALEYATAAPTCEAATAWTVVGSSGATWDMAASSNLTDGADTTNIAISSGGVTDENTVFIATNGGVRDATSSVSTLILDTTEFTEFEFSIQALPSTIAGETYCFRLTANNLPLHTYDNYAQATVAADVAVSALGTQFSQTDIPDSGFYIGGAFVAAENTSARTITSVTLTEQGTIDAANGLGEVSLQYDLDTTAPYDCVSESYAISDTLFGTSTFSAANGSSTFTGSVAISTTSTACFYVVVDVTASALNSETIDIVINSPASDLIVTSGSVGPSTPADIVASTTLQGAILSQTHYHWRNDTGTESSATSYTGGVEDSPVSNFALDTPIRLRLGISNEGATSSVGTSYRLEYGERLTTCDAIAVWTDVGETADDDWDMSPTANLLDGSDTTNIAVTSGGVSDENTTFLASNGGVRDTQSTTTSIILTENQHTDLEFSIRSTVNTSYDTSYCFRVVGNGIPLLQYDRYAELTTIPKRDFRVQRGSLILSGTATTVTAGIDYTAPAATSSAFVRITSTHHTAAGRTIGGGTQRANDVTAYISDQSDITSSITFSRDDAVDDTYLTWEIVEFIGQPGTDNEIIVRDVGTANFTNGDTTITGSAVSGIIDNEDVVVFVTGSSNQNTVSNYYAGQVTSEWASSTGEPIFTRGATGNAFVDVSYAVVEFVGRNWSVQRAEHQYAAAGVTETASIDPVNSLSRTFIHTQKRMGASTNVVHFGHTVWLSGLGTLSLELEAGASLLIDHTAVVWVIENTQTGQGAMSVQRLSGTTSGGAEPLALDVTIPIPILALNNASVFGNSRAGGNNNAFPRPIAALELTGTDTLELWRSDTGATLAYRTEIVEWPVAQLAVRQNYYRLYADNNQVTPSDPWPVGPNDLGENEAISDPLDSVGENEVVRARMTVRVTNAGLAPATESFKLQFAERTSTCSAVTTWQDMGGSASTTIWRGFAATGTADGVAVASDPPGAGELLISVSDVGGRLVEQNPSASNPYAASDGEDIEYDWFIEHNGADPRTVYCFRMTRLNEPLDGYFNYPTIRTAGFTPTTRNWRWYDDAENETPITPLAGENIAPSSITTDNAMTLRVTIDEVKGVTGTDVKFRLQFSEYADFRTATDLAGTSTCQETSLWCYADGPVLDNTTISTAVLSDSATCVGGGGSGCGTHNTNPAYLPGHDHASSTAMEYSFTLKSLAPRVNTTYYFRVLDAATNEPVLLAGGESFPSLVTESSSLDFTLIGLPSGTTTAGVVTTVTTTPTTINFGELAFNTDEIGAQRISVASNATEGFRVFKYARNQMLDVNGEELQPLAASNTAPQSWSSTCGNNASCVGYHTTDATLSGAATRFAAFDTYAGIDTGLAEVLYSSIATSTTEDLVYRVLISEEQPPGQYETDIVYIAVPVY